MGGRPDCTWCSGTGFSRSSSGRCDCTKASAPAYVPRARMCVAGCGTALAPAEHDLCASCFAASLERMRADDREFLAARALERIALGLPYQGARALPPGTNPCTNPACDRITRSGGLCPRCRDERYAELASAEGSRRQPGRQAQHPSRDRWERPIVTAPAPRIVAPPPAIVRPPARRVVEPAFVESVTVYDDVERDRMRVAFEGHMSEQRRPYPRSGSRRAA